MTNKTIAGGALVAAALVLLAFVAVDRALQQILDEPVEKPEDTASSADSLPGTEAHPSLIYGRVTTEAGVVHEGRLRFGGDEEAFWDDYFNASERENAWAAHAPVEQLTKREPLEVFGIEVFHWESEVSLVRQFMARFGDIAHIESNGWNVLQVTLKSGTVFNLNHFGADDFADGVRVWDGSGGVVDLDESQMRTIDFLAPERSGAVPNRLHGVVRTRGGEFTGFIRWSHDQGVGSDELDGRTADGEVRLRVDTLRSIARHSSNGARVTLLDGEEIVLSNTPDNIGADNNRVHVDDPRYGRVLISWDSFERADFSPGGAGPAYGDFPAGQRLTGEVTTRSGRRLAGRLVYDLDESETTETLDAPSQGVDYHILFGLIASVELPGPEKRVAERARLTLHSGEVLQLDLAGDLGEGNAGMLIFSADGGKPEYVRWTDVQLIRLDRPAAMYPPMETR